MAATWAIASWAEVASSRPRKAARALRSLVLDVALSPYGLGKLEAHQSPPGHRGRVRAVGKESPLSGRTYAALADMR